MKSATLIESTELLLTFLIPVFLLAHCYFLSCYFFSYLPIFSFFSCHFIHTATQMNCYLFSCFFFSHLSTVTFFPDTFFPTCPLLLPFLLLFFLPETVTFFPVTFFPVTFFPCTGQDSLSLKFNFKDYTFQMAVNFPRCQWVNSVGV